MPTLYRILRYFIIALALAALGESIYGCTAQSQSLPDAPTPRLMSADNIVLAYAISGRSLDIWSTQQFLGRGGHEDILPASIVDHPAAMVGFEAAVLGVEWIGARELRKRGHPKLSRLVFAIDGSATLATDIHNFQIQRSPAYPEITEIAPITPIVPASEPFHKRKR
jgi:hypothetical protein